MLTAYLELAVAIIFGTIGTVTAKSSCGYKDRKMTFLTVVAYIICYWSFAKCMQKVNLCAAYATWSAIGIAASAVIGIKIFHEQISRTNWGGVIILIAGVLLINM